MIAQLSNLRNYHGEYPHNFIDGFPGECYKFLATHKDIE